MNKLIVISFAALLLASCNDSDSQQEAELTPNTVDTSNITVSDPVQQTTPVNTNSNNSAALNPEHGAPGHRCDIPVGAPLNSPAGNDNLTPLLNTQNLPQQPVNNNVQLNPAHGQPGHDCSIPVGQPLRS
ncbi:MAG TPA: hypothetical protein VL095_01320 [Flavisolibacter sp.]|nr:hypothetical protein [Flavisolibacter sp.]